MKKLNVAVVGSGVAGLSCAWLLSRNANVTLFEAETRAGGHAHTHDFSGTPIDVGFIVYNEKTYPNFTALVKHLDVATTDTEMSFSVSLNDGAIEYASGGLSQLLGAPRNAMTRAHWAMLSDLARFCRTAKPLAANLAETVTLEEFLKQNRFSQHFIDRHLIPMAAAVWSSHPSRMLTYPAKAFIDFCENHQLLIMGRRDAWKTVTGGSINYVRKILAFNIHFHGGDAVVRLRRDADGNTVYCASGFSAQYDHVVFATHADQALAIIEQPTAQEQALLGPFKYSNNRVIAHRDATLMPTRRNLWSSWNYIGNLPSHDCGVTYWMNSLQKLSTDTQHFVSLNPPSDPAPELTDLSFECTHPAFTIETRRAQKHLWNLQGDQNRWFCGAYFGAGFHEDGLQSGLAVAEQLAGVSRPWRVANASGRIYAGNHLPFAANA